MKIHELKSDNEYFDDVESGLKTFEIRKKRSKLYGRRPISLVAF